MNCKKIRELIITDYIDGQIAQGIKKEVEEHLAICSKCRQFKQTVLKEAIEPFKRAEEVRPPDYLWYRIKDAIAARGEKESLSVFRRVRILWEHVFSSPRPVFALATISAVILMAVVLTKLPLNNQKTVNTYLEEQLEFLVHLDVNESDYFDTGIVSLGTSIEEYLL